MLLTSYRYFEASPLASAAAGSGIITVRRLGLQSYTPIWESMRYLIDHASPERGEEIWLLSHKPVYTQGQAGKAEHILDPGNIPVVQVDRGGQVTYHGPGQLVVYLLLSVRKRKMAVRQLVDLIESSVLETLEALQISGQTHANAPGIYVNGAKIAALGLRIRKGRSYHGLSLNVAMDLSPFKKINPCGFPALEVTQIADLVENRQQLMQRVSRLLITNLLGRLAYAVPETERADSTEKS